MKLNTDEIMWYQRAEENTGLRRQIAEMEELQARQRLDADALRKRLSVAEVMNMRVGVGVGVSCWLLDVGCWLLDVGCWMLDVGCWMLDVGCWLLAVGCWLFVLERKSSVGEKMEEDRDRESVCA